MGREGAGVASPVLPPEVSDEVETRRKTAAALVLPTGRNDEICWDADLEGFGLRLRQRSGGGLLRNWVCQYRANGHTRRVTIGSADKITPTQAREVARKTLAQVELGHDPQADKEIKRQQAALTFKAVVDQYLDAKRDALRPESYRIAKLYLTGTYFRSLHPMAIGAVTRADVASSVRTVTRKHSSNTAAAARRALSGFFSWAIADGLLGNNANPVDGSHRPADPAPRERVLLDAELVAIWKTCRDDDFGRLIRLLILLGSRRQEIGGMRWSELDLDAGTWALTSRAIKEPPRPRDHASSAGIRHYQRGAAYRQRLLVRVKRGARIHELAKRKKTV